jgi:hypothetical protein
MDRTWKNEMKINMLSLFILLFSKRFLILFGLLILVGADMNNADHPCLENTRKRIGRGWNRFFYCVGLASIVMNCIEFSIVFVVGLPPLVFFAFPVC